jgi:hypothetical protein
MLRLRKHILMENFIFITTKLTQHLILIWQYRFGFRVENIFNLNLINLLSFQIQLKNFSK